jgi:succinoglycan biosynthesis protein ExoA
VGRLLDWLAPRLPALGAALVVADGGSTDGTREIVARRAGPDITLLPNPGRLQSAAVNLAVERHADARTRWLLRVDAHAEYPPDFCEALLEEGERTGADAVVVSMTAHGRGFWQEAIALAQNSRFGNGGSAHRNASEGAWVEHGHHALMRLDAFREVGGYDPSFSHNEDAELDLRLGAAGRRIWLTGRTGVRYLPRAKPGALARQYWRFGRGRARTMLKHRRRPGLRQAVVIGLAPLLLLALLAPFHGAWAVPLGLWLLACLAAGVLITRTAPAGTLGPALAAGALAGLMQAAWSAGFWAEVMSRGARRRRAGP